MRIAVFASGTGSNYEAIMKYFQDHQIDDAEVVMLFSDHPGAAVLDKARNWNTPTVSAKFRDFSDKQAYEKFILQELDRFQVEFIVLAGYLRLIGSTLLDRYLGRIINIHPSLLPAFPGKDGVGQALAAKVQETGVTIHFVDQGMDTGPIIAQKVIPVELDDNHNSLTQKIQQVEHQLYPEIILAFVRGQVTLTDFGVLWNDSKSRS